MTLLITIIGIVFTVEESGAVNKELVLAYDFEKIQGNTVKDASKHGNDGELLGDPQMAESVMGQALAFDGEDDRLNLGSDASLKPTDAITIVAWIFIRQLSKIIPPTDSPRGATGVKRLPSRWANTL